MGMYGGGDTSGDLRAEQQAREQQILASQQGIDRVFQGFNPSFYQDREKAYLDYALPQLSQQFQNTQQNLVFDLANRGLLKSGAAANLAGSLNQELAKKQRQVGDQAVNESNALRQNIEQQRAQLYAQAQGGLAPSLSYSQALQAAGSFKTPSPFEPIGGLFDNWANIYTGARTAQAYGDDRNKVPGLTFPSGNAVKRVG